MKIIGSYSLRIVFKLNALQLVSMVSSLLCRPRAEDRERKVKTDKYMI